LSTQPSRSSEFAIRYPTLLTFSRSYLHQDWDLDFESPEAALLVFQRNHPDAAGGVAEAAAALLRELATEAERSSVLEELGWNFWGPPGRIDALLNWASIALVEQPAEKSTG
jgi:hypothetical protein